MTLDLTYCSDCGNEIDTSNDKATYRTPCSNCGSTIRTLGCGVIEEAIARDGLGVKIKRPKEKRPFIEERSMPSYSHIKKKLVHREMVVDRENDKYYEKITDYETGEIIHENQEPLSSHQNHGYAKIKKGS